MSAVDGVAAQALADFGPDFGDGVLTVPGERVSDGQGGYVAIETSEHPCKVLLTSPSDYRRIALGIPATDRLALVLGASVAVIPQKGHRITAPDPLKGLAKATFEVVAVSSDPAGALFKLQAR